MIPVRDVVPTRTTPAVTLTLIAVNTLVFLCELPLSDFELQEILATFGLVPSAFSWVTVVTSMFLHGGWFHFLGNMLYLWIFGDNVEDRLGHGRFLVFYLICGAAAALTQVFFDPFSDTPMVGASGAITGVMGAYFVLFPSSRVLTLLPLIIYWDVIEVPAVYFLGIWFLIQFFSGIGSMVVTTAQDIGGIAFWAHIGGFVAGGTGVFLFRRPERQRVEWWDGGERFK